MHKTFGTACFLILVAFMAACGGGGSSGGSDAPGETPGIEDEITGTLSAKAAQVFASALSPTVIGMMYPDAAGALSAKRFTPINVTKTLIDNGFGIFAGEFACTDGGSLTISGFGFTRDDGIHADYAASFRHCTTGEVRIHGRMEVMTIIALAGSSYALDSSYNGDQDEIGEAAPHVSDLTGVEPDVYLTKARAQETVDAGGGSVDVVVTSVDAMIESIEASCQPEIGGAWICGEPSVDPAYECQAVDSDCTDDAYCADVYGPLVLGREAPDEYSWRCFLGCCLLTRLAEFSCWGARECMTDEECGYPDFARFCVNGVCQGICETPSDNIAHPDDINISYLVRCRQGSKCSQMPNTLTQKIEGLGLMEEVTEVTHEGLVTGHAPPRVCACFAKPLNFDTCFNGVWEPEFNERCEGYENCPSGTECQTCVACMETACFDGLDNDDNGLTDCHDISCMIKESACMPSEYCDDRVDNDDNGLIDCLDPACANHPLCNEAVCSNDYTPNYEKCCNPAFPFPSFDDDGFDNCSDVDCQPYAGCAGSEFCNNGIDDDGDSNIDCDDDDCASLDGCTIEKICYDQIDNDGDGDIDCADADCVTTWGKGIEDCDDGVDNNCDGLVDCEDGFCYLSPACFGECDHDRICEELEAHRECEDCWNVVCEFDGICGVNENYRCADCQ